MNKKVQALIGMLCCLALLTCKKDDNPAQTPAEDYGTPTDVGTPIGSPSSTTIGAAGGSLLSPDGRSKLLLIPNIRVQDGKTYKVEIDL
jgi:hypothetical protein